MLHSHYINKIYKYSIHVIIFPEEAWKGHIEITEEMRFLETENNSLVIY